MRKLVTIRQISKLVEIPNCDNICLAIVDGWQVIVKKTEFQPNDYCLFFEIDSFIPASDLRFSFLNKTTIFDGKEGYRIKTMKLRGSLSQGLALPLSMFPEINNLSLEDYSEVLGVIKYDNALQEFAQKPGLKAGLSAGIFPTFIPKTDQERVQNLTSYFETMTDEYFEETLKLDGSSMTCYKVTTPLSVWQKFKKFLGFKVSNTHFGVCSRNLEITRSTASDFWNTVVKLNLEAKLPVGFAIQGELIGPKIQANHEKVQTLAYFIFDVYDINAREYLSPNARQKFCKENNLQHVPVISNTFQPFQMCLEDLLLHVEGESMNPGTISEGRVYKHMSKPISFKVISNKYLLKAER